MSKPAALLFQYILKLNLNKKESQHKRKINICQVTNLNLRNC